MKQSIEEGFTLDVLQNYTTYQRLFKLYQKLEFDVDVPSKKARRLLIKLVNEHTETVEAKVKIIVDHFRNHEVKEIEGQARAMIVVSSRKQCVQYFKEVNLQLKSSGVDY